MKSAKGVLFDLDGTLLDTAPDILFSLNLLREEYHLPKLPLYAIRPIANLGSKKMVKVALEVEEKDPKFAELREKFMAYYEQHLADSTRIFPNIDKVLAYLKQRAIPWGIVTNKLQRHAGPLLKKIPFDDVPGCVVCGDTITKSKPDPAPIIYACDTLKLVPDHCVYIGDALTDVIAGKAAGTRTLIALYGYIHEEDEPMAWKADGYVNDPLEIISWLTKYL